MFFVVVCGGPSVLPSVSIFVWCLLDAVRYYLVAHYLYENLSSHFSASLFIGTLSSWLDALSRCHVASLDGTEIVIVRILGAVHIFL